MPVIAVAALMGFLFLPGSAGAPAHAETISAPVAVSGEADEPSKRLAVSTETAQTYTVSMTAYNAVPGQTDSTPFDTASGMASNPEVVAARSQDMASELPFGTVIKLERSSADTPSCRFSDVEHLIGYRVIGDTMHARWTHKIDVLFSIHDTVPVNGIQMNPARVLGVCGQVTATVVGHVDPKHVPATQAELAAMFSTPTFASR